MIRVAGRRLYCDMYYSDDAVADETFSGCAACWAKVDYSISGSRIINAADALRYSEKPINGKQLAHHARAWCRHAPYTFDDRTFAFVKNFADRLNATIHVAENEKEASNNTARVQSNTGKSGFF